MAVVLTSILTTIKKMLGIDSTYDAFDVDVIINVNSALMVLAQLGVGPSTGFHITGATETWSSFLLDDTTVEAVKTYIYLKVRLIFDPPASSFVLTAIQEQIKEFEWRLMVKEDIPILVPVVVGEVIPGGF